MIGVVKLAGRASARLKGALGRMDRDEGGNVIVIYIAAALLLVAMLWAIIGTGARLVQKETIQTSADAAAFSAAVVKAKGMNLIAFCNLVMAILMAVILALRAIKFSLTVLLILCAVACIDEDDSLCQSESQVSSLKETFTQLDDQVEPKLKDAMKILSTVETVISKTFPTLSLLEGARVGMNDHYQKNFGSGLVTVTTPLPIGDDFSLPVKDGTWDDLCKKGLLDEARAFSVVVTLTGEAEAYYQGFYQGIWGTALCSDSMGASGGGENPKPLELKDNWVDSSQVRAFSVLTDSNLSKRRKSVAIATKNPGSSPMLNQLVSTAQAEFFPFYGSGHDDLWHMDWRARLVRFNVDSSSLGGMGSDIGGWLSALSSSGAGALADQFMVH